MYLFPISSLRLSFTSARKLMRCLLVSLIKVRGVLGSSSTIIGSSTVGFGSGFVTGSGIVVGGCSAGFSCNGSTRICTGFLVLFVVSLEPAGRPLFLGVSTGGAGASTGASTGLSTGISGTSDSDMFIIMSDF